MLPNFLKPYHTALSNLIRLGRKSDGGYVIDKRVISKTRAIITCDLKQNGVLKNNSKNIIIIVEF